MVLRAGSIGVEELGRVRFLDGQDYYRHLSSWWPRRDDPDVLLLAYEHMKQDQEGTVRRVAEFVGLGDDRRIAVACEESSLASMQAHADLLMRRRSEAVCGLPPSVGPGKVATGQAGLGRVQLSDVFVAELDAVWTATMGARHGLADYAALLDRSRHRRRPETGVAPRQRRVRSSSRGIGGRTRPT